QLVGHHEQDVRPTTRAWTTPGVPSSDTHRRAPRSASWLASTMAFLRAVFSPGRGDRGRPTRHCPSPRSRRDTLTTRTDELAVTCNTLPIETSTTPTTEREVP